MSSSLKIVLLVLISILMLFQASKLRFLYDIVQFYNQDDPEVQFYRDYVEDFENENDFLLIGLSNDKSIFKESYIRKIKSLSEILNELDGAEWVKSITSLREPHFKPFGTVNIPVVHWGDILAWFRT